MVRRKGKAVVSDKGLDLEVKVEKGAKSYSELERMKALVVVAGLNGAWAEASRQTGVPKSTLQYWAKYDEGTKALYQQYRDTLPGLIAEQVMPKIVQYNVEWIPEALDVIRVYTAHLKDEDVLKKTGAQSAAVIIGIMWDKIKAAIGQPTSVQQQLNETTNYNIDLIPADLKARLGDLYVQVEAVDSEFKEIVAPSVKDDE